MPGKYPYVASAGPLLKAVGQFRKSFPKEVNADTLRKLGVAPNNESYVINVFRFLDLIDDEGKKKEANSKAFVQHQEDAFASAFEELVHAAYGELFELHGDDAWRLDRGSLTQFFRSTDHSSDVVGSRQAATFMALAGLAGRAAPTAAKPPSSNKPKPAASAKKSRNETPKKAASPKPEHTPTPTGIATPPLGLTVRVEINLPATGDQETYDRIFQSIRRNLIDAE